MLQRKKERVKAELDAVNEYLEGLNKKCDYKVECYEERKANKLARHTTFLMAQAVAHCLHELKVIRQKLRATDRDGIKAAQSERGYWLS